MSSWASQVCTSISGWTPTAPSSSNKASPKAPTPTNSIQSSSPIQPGMVDNCDAFQFVKDGDCCSTIVQKNSISLSHNSTNGIFGTNCGGLWLEVYVCVSIIGHSPTTTTPPPSTTVNLLPPMVSQRPRRFRAAWPATAMPSISLRTATPVPISHSTMA
ncbi:hypothetical protein BU25DRAFT_470147 [Macroventuria anomochaeta]|uniref:Uncharacterized protein n=1 Tax=Macroventuria anomochaeta TaxID=301207 RepID=A0ACB6SES3_9PLEO|nr:uncharacterized protein BU25DRAFT_470147 [Macroventuria anomochaeta]KAF2632493.1 hypothetical protein BU25DRAFT_470147 [Macroventuria anomochaeta]